MFLIKWNKKLVTFVIISLARDDTLAGNVLVNLFYVFLLVTKHYPLGYYLIGSRK